MKGVCPHCGMRFVYQGHTGIVCPACGAQLKNPGESQAAQALAANRASLRSIPEVVSTFTSGGNIVVLVSDLSAPIPSTLNGVPVIVKYSDRLRIQTTAVLQAVNPQTRIRPVIGGLSVGTPGSATGTLGCIVEHKDKPYFLSNNHVFALCNSMPKGTEVIQPGAVDSGTPPNDLIGHLAGYVPYTKGTNIVDMALAEPVSLDVFENTIADIGGYIGVNDAVEGMACQKFGRTTSHTYGTVISTDADVQVDAEPFWEGLLTFADQILIESADPDLPFSAAGDSGSIVLDMNNNLIGLLFAGTSTITVINKIHNVIDNIPRALSGERRSIFPLLLLGGLVGIVGYGALAKNK